MYQIHDYIDDYSSISAIDKAFNGIRHLLQRKISKHILLLKWKNNSLNEAYKKFIKILLFEETLQTWRFLVNNATLQIRTEYTDPLTEHLITFDLDTEIYEEFRQRWRFTPSFPEK